MVLSDVAAHIDAALVVRSSEPRGLATRLPGEYIGWTSVVCHSVNSAHGPTLNETNVAGVGGGDARRARATATTHQSLRAHGIRAPSGAGRGGGGAGPTRHGSATAQLRWEEPTRCARGGPMP